jgi:amino acid transporter
MLALWGIKQSVMVAGTITVLEILGLVFVIIWGGFVADHAGAAPADLIPSLDLAVWSGILGATVLAFFAYIGFEDMVNVAEEVENPRRTMPLAIIVTLFVATVLYCAVSISVLLAVPVESLATSHAPLTLVFATAPSQIQLLFAALAVVATVNGVLIQMIMVSRVLYGMADQGNLPNVLARLSERTQTPTVATGLVAAGILVLSLFLPVEQLAEWTSQIVLTVFVFINMSLIAIKRQGDQKGDHFRVPILLPVFGALTSAALLVASLF